MEQREEQGGLWFSTNTPQGVRNAILNARQFNRRIRLWYGDTKTGKPWMEENDILGTIGRSTGEQKLPLLIANARSHGGGAIPDHCIVAIQTTDDKRFIYRHPEFELPKLSMAIDETNTEIPYCVYHENELYARFETRVRAERYIAFMCGGAYVKMTFTPNEISPFVPLTRLLVRVNGTGLYTLVFDAGRDNDTAINEILGRENVPLNRGYTIVKQY